MLRRNRTLLVALMSVLSVTGNIWAETGWTFNFPLTGSKIHRTGTPGSGTTPPVSMIVTYKIVKYYITNNNTINRVEYGSATGANQVWSPPDGSGGWNLSFSPMAVTPPLGGGYSAELCEGQNNVQTVVSSLTVI